MPIQELPIFTSFNKERFRQFNPSDSANFFLRKSEKGKKQLALYPALGRRNIRVSDTNKLDFQSQPRALFRSIDFVYAVVDATIFQIDAAYNTKDISRTVFNKTTGAVWFTYLPTPATVFCVFTDGTDIFLFNEGTGSILERVTDINRPRNPLYVAAFGNRIVVSDRDSTQFWVSRAGVGTASNMFTIAGSPLFAQESGKIRQMAVLHNQLFIFTDFKTGIWSNTSSTITDSSTVIPFPFKKNTSYDFDYGMADPNSLDVDFGFMCWLAKTGSGLVQFMVSDGGAPKPISTKAIDTLLESNNIGEDLSPFLANKTEGFLYQYENTIFYRASAGNFLDFGILDLQDSANSIEYNFDTQTWHRVIELNGERNRVQKHTYLNNRHLVTVENDTSIYEFSGRIYTNSRRNTEQSNVQASDAYIIDPMRYELVTPIITMPDYSEFKTDFVQIDFVFGENKAIKYDGMFENSTFIVDEEEDENGCPIYLVDEDGNFLITEDSGTPTALSKIYNAHFQPFIELKYSDDGGMRYQTADVREFSDLGVFKWRMRWYQLGVSRNRVYKLVCVSPSPIVILGGIMNMKPISGGAR